MKVIKNTMVRLTSNIKPDPIIEKIELTDSQGTIRAPKIIYHGTTALRLAMINKDGLLRCDMPKSEYLDMPLNKEYVYFTTHLDEALFFGLIKSLLDKRANDLEEYMKLNPNYRDPVVLGINTSKLGYNIEIDPEANSPLIKEMQDLHNSQWYRYKGDIKLKHLYVYKHVPFGNFSSDLITHLITKLMKYEQFHISQATMKQLSFVKIPKIGMVKIPKIGMTL